MDFDSSMFKEIARDALKHKWMKTVFTTLLASICGAFCSLCFFMLAFLGFAYVFINTFEGVQITAYLDVCLIAVIIAVFYFFIGGMIRFGYIEYSLAVLDRRRARISTIFSRGDCIWNGIGMKIYLTITNVILTCLLLLPGIYGHYCFAMVPYILSEREDYSVLKSMRMSRRIMKGHKWQLFCLRFSFIGWKLLGILTLGIGFLFIKPYQYISEAAFYNEISGRARAYYNRNNSYDPGY